MSVIIKMNGSAYRISSSVCSTSTEMIFVSGVMVLMLVALTDGSVGNSSSSYCSESRECLQFDLLCVTEDYEVRHYPSSWWVSTDSEDYFHSVGAALAFGRLYQYTSGENRDGVKLEMTAPILLKVPEETKTWAPATYTLSFLLPSAYQEKPPAPTNDKLYFSKMAAMDVYVRVYGGWKLSITSRFNAHLLNKALLDANAHFNHTHHYVIYDSLLKLNRHNEVWFEVDGAPVCESHYTNSTNTQ